MPLPMRRRAHALTFALLLAVPLAPGCKRKPPPGSAQQELERLHGESLEAIHSGDSRRLTLLHVQYMQRLAPPPGSKTEPPPAEVQALRGGWDAEFQQALVRELPRHTERARRGEIPVDDVERMVMVLPSAERAPFLAALPGAPPPTRATTKVQFVCLPLKVDPLNNGRPRGSMFDEACEVLFIAAAGVMPQPFVLQREPIAVVEGQTAPLTFELRVDERLKTYALDDGGSFGIPVGLDVSAVRSDAPERKGQLSVEVEAPAVDEKEANLAPLIAARETSRSALHVALAQKARATLRW